MKKLLLTLIVTVVFCGVVSAQDIDREGVCAPFTPTIDLTAGNGVKYWIKSYAPFQVAVGNSAAIWYSGHDAWDMLGLPEDNAYREAGTGEYSGKIDIANTVRIGDCDFEVTRIGYAAFASCTELTEVTLPGTLFDIRRGAFYGCTSLTEVLMLPRPDSKYARIVLYPAIFEGCTALRKVDLGDAYMVYGSIFQNCPALEEVTTSTDFSQLNAFAGRTEGTLKTINCISATPGDSQFLKEPYFSDAEFATTRIVVPDGSVAAYRAHAVWGRFENIVEQSQASVADVETSAGWQIARTGDLSARVAGSHNGLTVYSADGRRVASVAPAQNSFSVASRGLYIVSGSGRSQKIIF